MVAVDRAFGLLNRRGRALAGGGGARRAHAGAGRCVRWSQLIRDDWTICRYPRPACTRGCDPDDARGARARGAAPMGGSPRRGVSRGWSTAIRRMCARDGGQPDEARRGGRFRPSGAVPQTSRCRGGGAGDGRRCAASPRSGSPLRVTAGRATARGRRPTAIAARRRTRLDRPRGSVLVSARRALAALAVPGDPARGELPLRRHPLSLGVGRQLRRRAPSCRAGRASRWPSSARGDLHRVAYGFADVEGNRRVTPETVFDLGVAREADDRDGHPRSCASAVS